MRFDKEGSAVAADGSKLYYGIVGDVASGATPIVCANGIGCSTYFWKYIANYFGPSRPVIVWDYRGHGKSDLPQNKRVTVRQCAEDMLAVMDAAGVRSAVHIGHSMGSQVVFEFYRLFPDRTAGLVPLLGSFGTPLKTFWDSQIPNYIFPYVHKVATTIPKILQKVTGQMLQPALAFQTGSLLGIINGAMSNPADMTDYFNHISQVPVDLFFELAKDMSVHSCEDILGGIECPVLVIGGELDKFTPAWLSHKMHNAIPESELLMIKEGSHAALIEQPDLINLRLEKFFRERVEATAGALVGTANSAL
jgi:pimeloyl-ACP methyl ester carboxylesterase